VEGGGKFIQNLRLQQADEKRMGFRDPFAINNKHESLFCCGRRGVNSLILESTHFFYLLLIVLFSFALVNISPALKEF
jgi:hypothetical protein